MCSGFISRWSSLLCGGIVGEGLGEHGGTPGTLEGKTTLLLESQLRIHPLSSKRFLFFVCLFVFSREHKGTAATDEFEAARGASEREGESPKGSAAKGAEDRGNEGEGTEAIISEPSEREKGTAAIIAVGTGRVTGTTGSPGS